MHEIRAVWPSWISKMQDKGMIHAAHNIVVGPYENFGEHGYMHYSL
jgi:hypothetical protein